MKRYARLRVLRENINFPKDLFKEHAVRGSGYSLSDGSFVYGRELVYYGLKNFDEIDALLFCIGVELLKNKGVIEYPLDVNLNRKVRRWYNLINNLCELGILGREKKFSPYQYFYRYISDKLRERIRQFSNIGSILKEKEKELSVNPEYISHYILPHYEKIRAQEVLVGEKDLEILEKIFGVPVIKRYKSLRDFEKLLYETCSLILDGWRKNERIVKWVDERKINIPADFYVKIIPPKELLENSKFAVDQMVVSLLAPLEPKQLLESLPYSKSSVNYTLTYLKEYGIIEKSGEAYTLASLHPYEIARDKILERIEKRYRKYIKAHELYSIFGLSCTEIARRLNILESTIYDWLKRGVKPKPLFRSVALNLMKRGIISEDEVEKLERYGLVK